MGCGGGQKQEKIISQQIDQFLKEDPTHPIKLLLLGTGESGKSTFMKQLKILHANGFTDEEIFLYDQVIHDNFTECATAILKAAKEHENTLSSATKALVAEIKTPLEITPELGEQVEKLYSDEKIKTLVSRVPDEFQGSVDYFLSNAKRICAADYKPDNCDLLRCRTRTSGIHEVKLTINKEPFIVIDVGGQRTERRKWVHCFQDVTAIIFFVALSEYDMVLIEDPDTNRMQESLQLFDEICNCEWLAKVPIIMFLNKKDLFEEKIKKENITTAFPSYAGKQNFEEASKYIENQFVSLNENAQDKGVYPMITTATDTQQMGHIINSVTSIVLEKALEKNAKI